MTENKNMDNPRQVLNNYIKGCEVKCDRPLWMTVLLGVMAGAFISFGAAASTVAMYGVANTGISRTIAGVVFPIGLMLIVFIGGELFTGNCMMITGVIDKRYSIIQMLKNLVVVFLSNLAGAIVMALLIANCGEFGFSENTLGAYVIKIAVTKVNLPFGMAFISGILCNILVCAAVLMAAGAKETIGKIWAVFFPIFVFVICGFEHCVANMYYLSAGILASANSDYVAKAMEVYQLTGKQIETLSWQNMFAGNLLPVTLGNIVGGMVFIGLPVYFLNREKNKQAEVQSLSVE